MEAINPLPHYWHNPDLPKAGSYERYALQMADLANKAYENNDDHASAHYARMAQVYASLAGKQRF